MRQALSLYEEEEQELQIGVGESEVRVQEERTAWEVQRCIEQIIQGTDLWGRSKTFPTSYVTLSANAAF